MLTRKSALFGALFAASLAVPAFAQTTPTALPAPSTAWVRAIVDGLDAPTRAEVESRSTGGNHPYEVLRVILLNNMQLANLVQPGQPPLSDVVAIDFIREHVVVRQGDATRVLNFNRTNLTLKP
jgi:predicted methyltransferase